MPALPTATVHPLTDDWRWRDAHPVYTTDSSTTSSERSYQKKEKKRVQFETLVDVHRVCPSPPTPEDTLQKTRQLARCAREKILKRNLSDNYVSTPDLFTSDYNHSWSERRTAEANASQIPFKKRMLRPTVLDAVNENVAKFQRTHFVDAEGNNCHLDFPAPGPFLKLGVAKSVPCVWVPKFLLGQQEREMENALAEYDQEWVMQSSWVQVAVSALTEKSIDRLNAMNISGLSNNDKVPPPLTKCTPADA